MTAVPTLQAVRGGGKRAVADALTLIERTPAGDHATEELATLLDAAFAAPIGHVLGITGPPGVGKSTLINALVTRWRAAGETVAVIAVDPSSRITGGALLGDRTRIRTRPEDQGVFVRSMAARDRLGGLSAHTVAAMVLLRALYDRVILESVGIGQSETDIGYAADTVLVCVQPGSGDSLQFMKAGIMELPDIFCVTKADGGDAASRARADVAGAISLADAPREGWAAPVLAVSAATGLGIEDLEAAIAERRAFLSEGRLADHRAAQARMWVAEAVRVRYGSAGLDHLARETGADMTAPFAAIAAALSRFDLRFGPAVSGSHG